ncbi:MAG: ABC-type transport auxiliary lipoprotein family protein [Azoarcus sp.]|jgi:cholesterol transport system auxiliary component|nr:ABC-type transport auxiliary lipoprotein family protein [Azoarcus sp.]
MIPIRARRSALGLLCVPLCVACTILPAPEPVDIYLLPAAVIAPNTESSTPRAWSLRILRPEASGQLVAQRILVVPEPNRMSVYKGASWHEPTPLLLRNRLFDAFRTDARVSALSTDDMRTYADYELASDLSAFHSEYRPDGKVPEAVIRLDIRLIDTSSRRIVASRVFEVRQAAAEREIPSVVAAFGAAADRLAAELVDWVAARADATWRETAAEAIPVTPLQP